MTWADIDAMRSACPLPDPSIWANARASRKGWAEEPGYIVRGDIPVEAVRFYRREGSAFSGWIVREIFNERVFNERVFSDPLPNRAAALAALLAYGSTTPEED